MKSTDESHLRSRVNDLRTPFDKLLDFENAVPSRVRDALIWVDGTLEFCVAMARSRFGDQATPEHAMQIFEWVWRFLESTCPEPKFPPVPASWPSYESDETEEDEDN